MIELFRTADCPTCDEAIDALREQVLAHRVIPEDRSGDPPLPDGATRPALREGNRLVLGEAAIRRYVHEVIRFNRDWQRFQSDACFLDDDGEIC